MSTSSRAVAGLLAVALVLPLAAFATTPAPDNAVQILWDDFCQRKPEYPACAVATPSPSPSPTPAPTPAPTPVITPAPTSPASVPGFDMGIDWAALPLTGAAWDRVKALSDQTAQLDQSNIDAPNTNILLAKAARYRRTGEMRYRDQTIAMLLADKPYSTSAHEPALQLGRNLASRAIAAAWVGYTDPAYLKKLGDLRTAPTGSGNTATLIATHEKRGNNFSTAAGMSRIAIDLLIGDAVDLARAVQVHRGYVGERLQYTGFVFGDLSWQFDSTKPVGINQRGATKSGNDIDGVLPDDQRRGGSFKWPPPNENYVWQAQGELLVTTALLGTKTYGDSAVQRSYEWQARRGFAASGDDRWQPAMADDIFGVDVTRPVSGMQDGKSFGLTDWLYQ